MAAAAEAEPARRARPLRDHADRRGSPGRPRAVASGRPHPRGPPGRLSLENVVCIAPVAEGRRGVRLGEASPRRPARPTSVRGDDGRARAGAGPARRQSLE
ncbi:hypothetical protein NN561_005774 [Cricetulus griseus]